MTGESLHEAINRAVETHYGTLGWTEQAREAARAEVGDEAVARIGEMSSFANDPEHWVHAPSHMGAYNDVQRLLRERYPFLSPDAVQRIATSAAYGWK